MLWYGGRFQFLDLCPDTGCLAVEYTTTGEVAHAWPFRQDELEEAGVDDEEYPYELAIDHSFVRDAYPVGIERYADGDLLVTFQMGGYRPPFRRRCRQGRPRRSSRLVQKRLQPPLAAATRTTAQPSCRATGSVRSP